MVDNVNNKELIPVEWQEKDVVAVRYALEKEICRTSYWTTTV